MTRPSSSRACAASVVVLLATMAAFVPSIAAAQQDSASFESSTPIESATVAVSVTSLETSEAPPTQQDKRLQVGDATHRLLAMQRDGSAASTTPRPLAGEVASLSYKRYLDSFKFPIPERFGAAVQKSGNTGSR